ncbi:MAG: hypothetical protein WCH46_02225 [bacterium]
MGNFSIRGGSWVKLRLRLVIVVLAIVSVGLCSCDLFSTRTPEPPDIGSSFVWTPASIPSTLLDNLKHTLESLDATNYTKCFLNAKDSAIGGEKVSFMFVPRAGIDAASRSIFDSWTTQSENNFMSKLRSALVTNPRLSVIFSNAIYNQSSSNNARINSDYLIVLPTQSGSAIPDSLRGSMILQTELVTTEQSTTEWRVVNWSDFTFVGSSLKTFTDLKVQLSS